MFVFSKCEKGSKKVSSESWVRSFINAIKDYQKLDHVGSGETEILGLKIDMEKGIVQHGYPDSYGKSYFDLKLLDTGTLIRVYEDNTLSVWHRTGFARLKIEQLEADGVNTKPLEVVTGGGTRSGTDLTTILMRDYLEKIGFFDKFVIGQETDEVFGVKGTVKAKGVSSDGPYVTITFEADTGRGSGVKEVRITPDGATVNEYPIVDIENGEDGTVYLHYKHGDDIWSTPIKLPDTIVYEARFVEAEYLTTRFDYNDIQGKTGASDLLEELDIKSSKDYTRRVAYAAFGGNHEAFDAQYGDGKCDALLKVADAFSKSAAEEALENTGLKVTIPQAEPGGFRPLSVR